MKKISIKDISEKTGVSIATVSRVINHNGRFSRETEERVLRVIREYDYQPNMIAKGLRQQKTTNVGILVPDIKNEFFAKLVYAIESNLYKKGYYAFVCNTDEDEAIERNQIERLLMQKVCGLVCISGTADQAAAKTDTVPMVYIDRFPKENTGNASLVTSDNVHGGFLAGRELLECGVKKPLFIGSHREVSAYAERETGFKQALAEAGMVPEEDQILRLKNLHYQDAYEAMGRFLDQGGRCDGIFAASDWLALGSYMALTEHGIRIPQEVKLVGYDDISLTVFNALPLTTVHQDIEAMGAAAAEQLLRAVEGEESRTETVRIPVRLVARASTRG